MKMYDDGDFRVHTDRDDDSLIEVVDLGQEFNQRSQQWPRVMSVRKGTFVNGLRAWDYACVVCTALAQARRGGRQ